MPRSSSPPNWRGGRGRGGRGRGGRGRGGRGRGGRGRRGARIAEGEPVEESARGEGSTPAVGESPAPVAAEEHAGRTLAVVSARP